MKHYCPRCDVVPDQYKPRKSRCKACGNQMSAVINKRARQLILKKLGFWSYAAYLDSPLWQGIRLRILKRDKMTCVKCSGKAWIVHHRSYSEATLRGLDDGNLVATCLACHEEAERDEDGRKTTLKQANRVLGRSRFAD